MPKVETLPRGGTVTYYSRREWGAGPLERGAHLPMSSFKGLVVHDLPQLDEAMDIRRPTAPGESGEPFRFMRRLQEVRPDLGSEIPYSWNALLGHAPGHMIVCEGRGPGRSGAHTANINSARYGVGVAIDTEFYDATDPTLLDDVVEAVEWIGRTFVLPHVGEPEATTGHKDWAHLSALNRTSCPGPWIPVAERAQPPYNSASSPPKPAPSPPASNRPALPSGSEVDDTKLIRPGDYGIGVEAFQRRLGDVVQMMGVGKSWQIRQHVPWSLRLRRMGPTITGVHDDQSVAWCSGFQTWAGIDVDGLVGNVETRPALVKTLAELGEPWAQT